MTLELKYPAFYLPYDVRITFDSDNPKMNWNVMSAGHLDFETKNYKNIRFKLILRPLSDLTKEIEHNGERFVPSVKLGIHVSRNHVKEMPKEFSLEILGDVKYRIKGFYNYTYLKYSETQKLLEWHFDLFGLIENGLAVDINTLEA